MLSRTLVVKYSLLEIIEACKDIASHIISIYKFQRPKTYSEIFSILGENKLINTEMRGNLSEIAKFRNLLVHSYAKVENKKVLKYIKEELDNVGEFVKIILSLV
ncbi:MAG: DUF86 domain-containing protein [Candidatus Lokiarchaeota archaeon]|nr:DUF86 domain-containing protein [Candidatus Lokiarchaeota archaeon]MBD3200223.1 DUF86 domain-containing protein [Candidatus Lokiarchaeota archaeon]